MFIESIRITNGRLCHVDYHIERVISTLIDNYGFFEEFVSRLTVPPTGTHKLRIIYDNKGVVEHTVTPYQPRVIQSLRLIECDTIDYHYKYANRQEINRLLACKHNADDIMIVKHQLVTDSSFSNLLFFNGYEWITPAQPLLKGTCRERLIRNGVVKEDNISVNQLDRYQRVMLVNAMLDFDEQRVIEMSEVLK